MFEDPVKGWDRCCEGWLESQGANETAVGIGHLIVLPSFC